MTRTILFAAAALATIGSTSLTPNRADAAISTLGDCYNAVITWCNNTHPENASECANAEGGGLDQCDDEFANVAGGGLDLKIQSAPARGGKPGLRIIAKPVRQSTPVLKIRK